jgi:putative restriction endonuclease
MAPPNNGPSLRSEEIAKRWLGKLTKLNPNRARPGSACRGYAPHKPLLLLCLLDMAEAGELTSRTFARSAGLVLRFRSYGTIVAERWPSKLDVRLPFYHLSSQKFWEPFTSEMQRATSDANCVVCDLHPEFFELLADASFRMKARLVLTSKYFETTERIALLESMGLQGDYGSSPSTGLVLQEAAEAAKRKGRCARFAVRVVSEYRFTCALTGYCCMTAEGASIVEAAHIEPWAETQNDDVTNGLALSKNAHWMFDEGLWSVDDNLRIVVNAKKFKEHGPEVIRLGSFAGRHLQFDPGAKLRPAAEFLRRHRKAY